MAPVDSNAKSTISGNIATCVGVPIKGSPYAKRTWAPR